MGRRALVAMPLAPFHLPLFCKIEFHATRPIRGHHWVLFGTSLELFLGERLELRLEQIAKAASV